MAFLGLALAQAEALRRWLGIVWVEVNFYPHFYPQFWWIAIVSNRLTWTISPVKSMAFRYDRDSYGRYETKVRRTPSPPITNAP
jgi:hypothetical protein